MIGFFFILAAGFLITAFFFFDKIIKFQYKNYRAEWEEDGHPAGFFWNSPESKIISGIISRNVHLLSLTFGNRDWMKKEPKILKIALLMRICVFSFWALIITISIFALNK